MVLVIKEIFVFIIGILSGFEIACIIREESEDKE